MVKYFIICKEKSDIFMDENNIIDIKNILQKEERQQREENISSKKSYKNQTNPIFKKNLLINVRENSSKFKVSDLFN